MTIRPGGAGLRRPEVEGARRQDGADPAEFWEHYLSPLASSATEFISVREAGDEAVLEWQSTGELATGRPIEYAGVSLLTFDDQDKIARFATYFDTAAFVAPSDIT
ncbi:nuclear transport factor 2 family protein [Luteipulveratus flavus]|uniref:Nuclear transport factor 2 family protein n=1 Tax=Luteipulveratus flavus TaxID=3031728 RepID=A0ABT6CAP5_9MICO|nr:nuclear transport factor 2 family protein [Luteipulveratus sp. YIM 133296]MDF8265957.1 nuclear transport factor 2 family protein [Luteipulveratus sp. YIM 133296]